MNNVRTFLGCVAVPSHWGYCRMQWIKKVIDYTQDIRLQLKNIMQSDWALQLEKGPKKWQNPPVVVENPTGSL